MDPRKSAKVTAPDLLAAFGQDTQGAGQAPKDSGRLRLWVVLFDETDGPSKAVDYPLGELEHAMVSVTAHLAGGSGRAVAMVVSASMPELFRDAVQDISQLER